jgi:hypothetical protein
MYASQSARSYGDTIATYRHPWPVTYDAGRRPGQPDNQPKYQMGAYPVGPDTTMQLPPVAGAVPPVKKSRTPLLIVGIIAAVLVLCCGGTMVIGLVSGKPKSQPQVTAPVSDSPYAVLLASPSDAAAAIAVVDTPSPAATTAATPVPTPATTTSKPQPAPTTHNPPPPTTHNPPPPPPTPGGPPTHSGPITPGAFCKVAEEGWIGYSAAGKAYVCRDIDHNGHPHWVLP